MAHVLKTFTKDETVGKLWRNFTQLILSLSLHLGFGYCRLSDP